MKIVGAGLTIAFLLILSRGRSVYGTLHSPEMQEMYARRNRGGRLTEEEEKELGLDGVRRNRSRCMAVSCRAMERRGAPVVVLRMG
jgi:hypothetical protein